MFDPLMMTYHHKMELISASQKDFCVYVSVSILAIFYVYDSDWCCVYWRIPKIMCVHCLSVSMNLKKIKRKTIRSLIGVFYVKCCHFIERIEVNWWRTKIKLRNSLTFFLFFYLLLHSFNVSIFFIYFHLFVTILLRKLFMAFSNDFIVLNLFICLFVLLVTHSNDIVKLVYMGNKDKKGQNDTQIETKKQ